MQNIRDYDKEPIVIDDKLPKIVYVYIATIILLTTLFVLNFMSIEESKSLTAFSIVSWLTCIYFMCSLILKNNKIVLTDSAILREGVHNLKIEIKDIVSIRKTFIDFYDKSQTATLTGQIMHFFLLPFTILIMHPMLILTKFIYKIIFGLSNKSINDTIMIFDEDENFISIFIGNKSEYLEIEEYFKRVGFDIKNAEFYYTNQYSCDEITHYFNTKNKKQKV
ncbi:MAG: hypothetical protein LBG67_04595 [Campylobacteraceae bacterium]|jgi:hypothetical protein|nr:hypothetical protein [Campylobacteraceae bacterium]